jgi:hypothetical protein
MFEYRTELFELPVPAAKAFLMKVVIIEVEAAPKPDPVASRGAVCSPSDDSEPAPDALALLHGVLND